MSKNTFHSQGRTAIGARPEMSAKFVIDAAKRLVRRADVAGLPVNRHELRMARRIVASEAQRTESAPRRG